MFGKDIEPDIKEGRPVEDPVKSLQNEEFINRTNKKIIQNRIRRETQAQMLLFDINLEERRCKLRKLIESEINDLINEDFIHMETMEKRKKNLLERAQIIRRQTELERQELSNNKKTLLHQMNNDSCRKLQLDNHTKLIAQDWDKIKDIKTRITREKECEDNFWHSQVLAKTEDMLSREKVIQIKNEQVKQECLERIAANKERDELEKDEKIIIRDKNLERIAKLNDELAAEELERCKDRLIKQKEYHTTLDKHLEFRKALQDKKDNYEKSYDIIMNDENVQKLRNIEVINTLKKEDAMKNITDFMHYNKCLKEQNSIDNTEINRKVMEVQKDLHFKRRQIDLEKAKKYDDLIRELKNAQKLQLVEKEKVDVIRRAEGLKDREFFNKIYNEGLKEDELKKEKREEFVKNHYNELKSQINYREGLRELFHAEHQRERKSMQDAEIEYIKTRNDIIAKEKLTNIHPWRLS